LSLSLGQLIEVVLGCNAIKAGVDHNSPEWNELCLFQQTNVEEIVRRLERSYELKHGEPVERALLVPTERRAC